MIVCGIWKTIIKYLSLHCKLYFLEFSFMPILFAKTLVKKKLYCGNKRDSTLEEH